MSAYIILFYLSFAYFPSFQFNFVAEIKDPDVYQQLLVRNKIAVSVWCTTDMDHYMLFIVKIALRVKQVNAAISGIF